MGCNHAKSIKQRRASERKDQEEEKCKSKVKYTNADYLANNVGAGRTLYKCKHCAFCHTTHRTPRIVNKSIAEQKAQDVLDMFR